MKFDKNSPIEPSTKPAKMSWCQLLFIAWAVSMAVLTFLLYTPLPAGMEDHSRAMLGMAGIKILIVFPQRIGELLGQGKSLNNLRNLQSHIYREEDSSPASTWFGRLNVTRATIEGLHVIVYRHWDAEEAPLRPGTIYFHGGGWIFANADSYDWTVYELALGTGTVAISVDYRLAPQHTFPAGFDDAVAVTRHVLRYGRRYGIDVTQVGVSGDSAGANLAAAAALHLTRTPSELPALRYQILICPILQALNYRLPSYSDNSQLLPILSPKHVGAFASLYLGLGEENGDFHGSIFEGNRHVSFGLLTTSKYAGYVNESNLPEKYRSSRRKTPIATEPHDETVFQKVKDVIVDPRFAPLMADDLSGLPATHIVVEEFDVVRDDGLLYAKRLKDAGVETSVHHGQGYHNDHIRMVPEFLYSKSGAKVMRSIFKFTSENVKRMN